MHDDTATPTISPPTAATGTGRPGPATARREAADPHCLTDEQARAALAGAPWHRLVVMGDSIAAGIGDPVDGYRDLPWAERLAGSLRAATGSLAYLNLGMRGVRAGEARAHQLDRALAFAPDLAVVACGANDALRRSFSPPAVEAEIEAVVGPLHAAGALVVTFGVFDLSTTSFVPAERRSGLRARLHALGDLTRAVARRHGGVHVDFLGHPATDDDLFSDDRIHVNRRGHAIVAAETVRSLGHHLASRPARAGRPC